LLISDFNNTHGYQRFPLDFYSNGDLVEFRVFYYGSQTVSLDAIGVQPSSETLSDWRAVDGKAIELQAVLATPND
jgi:hypothetical protein